MFVFDILTASLSHSNEEVNDELQKQPGMSAVFHRDIYIEE